jgi:peptidoglycan/LPS O-acetylase OafA/YrhL
MNYRPEIDGLRAVAVVPVILFHAGFGAFGGGYVGVDVFFVISGYLITSIILAEHAAGRFSLLRFYERRARRILPALFLVMAACLPFAWLWLMPSDMRDFSKSLASMSLFASNVFFYKQSGYFDAPTELKPLLHTWGLAVEEQYYLLFPLLLLLALRLGRRSAVSLLVVAATASLALAQWGSTRRP